MQRHVDTRSGQVQGAGETGQTGSEDDNIGHRRNLPVDNSGGLSANFPTLPGMTERVTGEPVLSGYDDLTLLGFGSAGEVWRATHRRTGDLVAVRRLVGVDRDVLAAVRAASTVVRGLASEHLVRVRTTVRSNGEDLLVLDHAAGGPVPTDRVLLPGEVVTVVAPVAEALGQAHAAGLVHGRLEVGSLLLDDQGRPLLEGLGLAVLHDPADGHDPTGALGPSADVWAVGALAHRLLTGQAPGDTPLADLVPTAPVPLLAAITSALRFDPTTRPTADALSQALLAACPAIPLSARQVPRPGARPVPRPGARPGPARIRSVHPRRRPTLPTGSPSWLPLRLPSRAHLLSGAAAVAALLAVVAGGVLWGRHASDGPGGVPLATPAVRAAAVAAPAVQPVAAWTDVLTALDARRAEAFRTGRVALLDEVYDEGSAAGRADRAALAALVERGATVDDLRHAIDVVTPLRTSDDRVELEVEESLPAYVVHERDGQVRHAAGAVARHTIVLTRRARGWLVAQVSR